MEAGLLQEAVAPMYTISSVCRNPSFHGSGFTTHICVRTLHRKVKRRNPSFHGSGFTTGSEMTSPGFTIVKVAILVFMEAGLLPVLLEAWGKVSVHVAILVFMEAGLLLEKICGCGCTPYSVAILVFMEAGLLQ